MTLGQRQSQHQVITWAIGVLTLVATSFCGYMIHQNDVQLETLRSIEARMAANDEKWKQKEKHDDDLDAEKLPERMTRVEDKQKAHHW